MNRILLVTTIFGGLLFAASANAQTCTAVPTCTSLGYTNNVSDCSGEYIKCPFDETSVKCFPATQAQGNKVGDLKDSYLAQDHDGWLLCDGRNFSPEEYPDLSNVLGDVKLPNYTGSEYNKFIYPGEYKTFSCKEGQFLYNTGYCSDTYDSSNVLGLIYDVTAVDGKNCFNVSYAIETKGTVLRESLPNTAASLEVLKKVFKYAGNSEYANARLSTKKKYVVPNDPEKYTCKKLDGLTVQVNWVYYTCSSSECVSASPCTTIIPGYTHHGCSSQCSGNSVLCNSSSTACQCEIINGRCIESPTKDPFYRTDYEYCTSNQASCTKGYYLDTATTTICGINN